MGVERRKRTLSNGRSKKSAKGTSQCRRREEEGVPLLRLGALVPHANQVEAAREHSALEDAEEESSDEDTGIVLREALQRGDETKTQAADGQPDAR